MVNSVNQIVFLAIIFDGKFFLAAVLNTNSGDFIFSPVVNVSDVVLISKFDFSGSGLANFCKLRLSDSFPSDFFLQMAQFIFNFIFGTIMSFSANYVTDFRFTPKVVCFYDLPFGTIIIFSATKTVFYMRKFWEVSRVDVKRVCIHVIN